MNLYQTRFSLLEQLYNLMLYLNRVEIISLRMDVQVHLYCCFLCACMCFICLFLFLFSLCVRVCVCAWQLFCEIENEHFIIIFSCRRKIICVTLGQMSWGEVGTLVRFRIFFSISPFIFFQIKSKESENYVFFCSPSLLEKWKVEMSCYKFA